GLFRSPKGTVAPGEFARELGLDEQSPALPHWLSDWSQSCDDMSLQLRGEEAR
ncbi:MAG: thioesterase, partial [Pseudomonas sp.]|nr:thioesterase [Pseudomonas sp.]